MGGWTKLDGARNEQTYETAPYRTEVVAAGDATDMSAAAAQLRHARERLTLQTRYPGRDRTQRNVVDLGKLKRQP